MLKFDVDDDKCIGCNVCVDACPGNFIKPLPSVLSVELPEVCAACGLCEKLCPVDAIDLEVELGPAKPAAQEGLVWDESVCEMDGGCARACPNEAIRVITADGIEIPGDIKTDVEPSYNMCVRCGACASACPKGALTLVEMDKEVDGKIVKRNRIEYSPDKCDKCGDCIDVCPYNMLKLTDDKVPLKGFCILCDQCIPACPNSALSIK